MRCTTRSITGYFRRINGSTEFRDTVFNKIITEINLANLYQYIGIQKELTKYESHKLLTANNTNSLYPSSIDYIHTLNQQVATHLVPMLQKITTKTTAANTPQNKDTAGLNDLLSSTSTKQVTIRRLTPLQEQFRNDERIMLRLEKYVTFDGTINFLSQLLRTVFGVTLQEENNTEIVQSIAWDNTVRLFHLYDTATNTYFGSFLVDPYDRDTKLNRAVSMPLVLPVPLSSSSSSSSSGISNTPPTSSFVAVVSLQLPKPLWDDTNEPTLVSWENCETIFHELGHVLQLLLPRYPLQYHYDSIPFDFTEFLPKFMEQWLNEKSTIQALVRMSQLDQDGTYTDEELDAAYRVRSKRKAYELTQQAFYSELEMELFTSSSGESILDIQQRLATTYIPHDNPAHDDVRPILEIVQDTIAGRQLSIYRYLWCDCIAASIMERIKQDYTSKTAASTKSTEEYESSKNSTSASSSDTALSTVQLRLRKYLLDPGASVDVDAFLQEFQIPSTTAITPQSLFERFGLLEWKLISKDPTNES